MPSHARARGGEREEEPDGSSPEQQSYVWHRSVRHTNTNKSLCQLIWTGESGYTKCDRDVLSFYFYNAPVGRGILRLSQAEIADKLGMKAVTVGRCVRRLARGRLLLPGWSVGRTTFYWLNPLLNFDGPSAQQRAAVFGVPVPLVPYPGDKTKENPE